MPPLWPISSLLLATGYGFLLVFNLIIRTLKLVLRSITVHLNSASSQQSEVFYYSVLEYNYLKWHSSSVGKCLEFLRRDIPFPASGATPSELPPHNIFSAKI